MMCFFFKPKQAPGQMSTRRKRTTTNLLFVSSVHYLITSTSDIYFCPLLLNASEVYNHSF